MLPLIHRRIFQNQAEMRKQERRPIRSACRDRCQNPRHNLEDERRQWQFRHFVRMDVAVPSELLDMLLFGSCAAGDVLRPMLR
ncbi:hypothetical protein MRX96_017151 [Rhipicephalus microplus]